MAKLDGEGRWSDGDWNERWINDPSIVFLKFRKDGKYLLHNHDCDFKQEGFPLHHWCGADPTKHSPKVKTGDRVVATTKIQIGSSNYCLEGYAWEVTQADNFSEPFLPNGVPIRYLGGYRLATKYDRKRSQNP